MHKNNKLIQDNKLPISRLQFKLLDESSFAQNPKEKYFINIDKVFANKIIPYPFYKKINREL